MKTIKLFALAFLLLCGTVGISAQTGIVPGTDRYAKKSDTAAGTCTAAKKGYVYFSTTTNTVKSCDGTVWSSGGGGGVTNGAGANVIAKSDGTNIVASSFSNGTANTLTGDTTNVKLVLDSGAGSALWFGAAGSNGVNASTHEVRLYSDSAFIWWGNIGGGQYALYPNDDNSRDFGGASNRWKDGYFSGLVSNGGAKRVAANATNATATMSSLSDITITVAAAGKYAGTLSFLAKNSTAAEGIAFDFNGGSATITSVQFGFTCTPPGVTLGTINSTALATAITATTATTTDVWYTVNFIVVVNAAGTIIPRFAEVSHTSGTVTVEAGSFSDINRY